MSLSNTRREIIKWCMSVKKPVISNKKVTFCSLMPSGGNYIHLMALLFISLSVDTTNTGTRKNMLNVQLPLCRK